MLRDIVQENGLNPLQRIASIEANMSTFQDQMNTFKSVMDMQVQRIVKLESTYEKIKWGFAGLYCIDISAHPALTEFYRALLHALAGGGK